MRFPLPCESEINDLRTSRPTRRQTTGMSVSKFKQDSDRENVDSKYFKKVKSKKHHSSEETESETTIEMMNGRLQAEKARKNADVEDCQWMIIQIFIDNKSNSWINEILPTIYLFA